MYLGQATVELKAFQKVYGVDPSIKMLESAQSQNDPAHQIEYRQSNAENVPFLEDSSVDLIVSGLRRHQSPGDRKC